MKSLSQFVKYNNWEKLEENIQSVTENNFTGLIATAVVYHCKECFDILMKLPNRISWINKRRGHWKLRHIFENYAGGPNQLNKYYLVKVFEMLEYIDTTHVDYLLADKNIFSLCFNRMVKTKSACEALLYRICKLDDVDAFEYVHNYLSGNLQAYPFYTNQFVCDNLIYEAVCSNAINIVKKIHELGYPINKTKYQGQEISTLVLILSVEDFEEELFKFVYGKYPAITQNLLWANWIEPNYYESHDYFLQLEFSWTPTVDFAQLLEDYANDYQPEPFPTLTQDNLLLRIQIELNDLQAANGVFSEAEYNFATMITNLDFLIELIPEYPELAQYLKTTLVMPNIDPMQIICSAVYGSLKSMQNNKPNTSRYWRRRWRSRHAVMNRRLKAAKDKLEMAFNIVKFMKSNKLSNYNPLQVELFDEKIKLNKAKEFSKMLLMHMMKLGFVVSEEFKTKIVDKVFNKTELKALNVSIEKLKSDNFSKDLKGLMRPKKSGKKRKSKKNAVVPAMDDPDSDLDFDELDQVQAQEIAQALDIESDSDDSDEIEV